MPSPLRSGCGRTCFTFVGFPFFFRIWRGRNLREAIFGYRTRDFGDIRLLAIARIIAEMGSGLGASFLCSPDSKAEQPWNNLSPIDFSHPRCTARPQLSRISIERPRHISCIGGTLCQFFLTGVGILVALLLFVSLCRCLVHSIVFRQEVSRYRFASSAISSL